MRGWWQRSAESRRPWALPYVSKTTGRDETAPGEPSTTPSLPSHGGTARPTLSEESEVTDVSLRGLTPISELLPVGKTRAREESHNRHPKLPGLPSVAFASSQHGKLPVGCQRS